MRSPQPRTVVNPHQPRINSNRTSKVLRPSFERWWCVGEVVCRVKSQRRRTARCSSFPHCLVRQKSKTNTRCRDFGCKFGWFGMIVWIAVLIYFPRRLCLWELTRSCQKMTLYPQLLVLLSHREWFSVIEQSIIFVVAAFCYQINMSLLLPIIYSERWIVS